MDLTAHKIREGDSEAFDQLFMAYHHRVFLYALKLTRSREDAREVMQETFLLVWKKRASLDPYQSVEGLLFKITKDLCLNYLRGKLRERAALDRMRSEQDLSQNPEVPEFSPEQFAILNGAISGLPEKQRIILQMNRFMGFSYQHIADRLGISKNTVKVQLVRANKSLKKFFAHFSSDDS